MQQTFHEGKAFDLADLGEIAAKVKKKFNDGGVQIDGASELGRIIRAASVIGTEAAKPHDVSVDSRAYHDAHSLARLAQTIIPLGPEFLPKKRLRSLYDGDLNFWSSTQSLAKDTEWECLVAGLLAAGGLNTAFAEPPDIHFSGVGRSIGVACKKIYSLSNARKQISKGLKQIAKSSIPGILALSLDFLATRDEGAYSYYKQGDIAGAQRLAGQVLAHIADRLRINQTIEQAKILGTILYSHFYVQDKARPHLFMDVSAIRITHRGTSTEAKRIMDRVDGCLAAWMKMTLGEERVLRPGTQFDN
jgi:hypothetical protein